MLWFGKYYNSPAYDEDEHVPIPLGEKCGWCDEPIGNNDDGFFMSHMTEQTVSMIAYHRACHMRQIFGSLAHCQRRCSCYVSGSTCTDPPEMTKREAAEAVVEYMELA
jgi:hypothetical protein